MGDTEAEARLSASGGTTVDRYSRLRGSLLKTAQDVFTRLVSGHGAVDVHAVHDELDGRSLLAVGLSISSKKAIAFIDFQKDEFCTGSATKLLAHEVGDVKFGERSVEESFDVALCALRRYAMDEDLHVASGFGTLRVP